jgi:hypothetical protein
MVLVYAVQNPSRISTFYIFLVDERAEPRTNGVRLLRMAEQRRRDPFWHAPSRLLAASKFNGVCQISNFV